MAGLLALDAPFPDLGATLGRLGRIFQTTANMQSCMNSLLISGIMPVFNRERCLREALDSILAQPYRPIEIIVVDDAARQENLDWRSGT